jgi:hypothetical protein
MKLAKKNFLYLRRKMCTDPVGIAGRATVGAALLFHLSLFKRCCLLWGPWLPVQSSSFFDGLGPLLGCFRRVRKIASREN